MVNLDKVIHGIYKYMNREIYSKMNAWQTVLARFAVARMTGDPEKLKALMANPFVKTLAIFDKDGDVDIDSVMSDIKQLIAEQGKISVSIPLFGDFTFTPEDVDKLHRDIMEA